jgi:hypothetical protein
MMVHRYDDMPVMLYHNGLPVILDQEQWEREFDNFAVHDHMDNYFDNYYPDRLQQREFHP